MPTLTFTPADAGLVQLTGRFPRLFFVPESPSTTTTHLLVTAPVEATPIAGTDQYEVTVVASDDVLPRVTYTLLARWDAGDGRTLMERLIVPADATTLRDVMIATDLGPQPQVFYGFGDPTRVYPIYLDISGLKPVLHLRGVLV